jgi:hypothetical protein
MDFGKFFKGLFIATMGYLVIVCLWFTANTTIFSSITADKNEVKSILSGSGVYDEIAPVLIDESIRSSEDKNIEKILSEEGAKQAVEKVFNPDYNRVQIEKLIDGTYSWLEGDIPQPNWQIDLAPAHDKLASELAAYAENRAQKLPPCNLQQLASLQSNYDFLSLECLPPINLETADIKSEIDRQLNSGTGVLNSPTIKPNDIKSGSGKPIHDEFSNAPQAFKTAKLLPWIIGLFGLFAAAALVLMSETKRVGLRRLGFALLAGGLLLAITPAMVNYSLDSLVSSVSVKNETTGKIIGLVMGEFNGRAAVIYYAFGLASLLAGTATLAVRHFKFKG